MPHPSLLVCCRLEAGQSALTDTDVLAVLGPPAARLAEQLVGEILLVCGMVPKGQGHELLAHIAAAGCFRSCVC